MCFSYTIDTARSTALDFSTIKSYFDNLGEVLREHEYLPSAIYIIDETGFPIGSSKKSVILLDQLNQRRENKQSGRKEWITCLVYQRLGDDSTSVSDFKGENLNSGWGCRTKRQEIGSSLRRRRAGLTTRLDS
jgi:hypothetical protein